MDQADPLLLTSIQCPYAELAALLRLIQLESCYLTPDLVRRVISFLVVKPIQGAIATACSSTDNTHPLSCCLTEDESTWYMSGPTMQGGRGEEYIDFEFSKVGRLSSVAIKIPPLPQGPLSVWEFQVQASSNPLWTFRLTNRTEWQSFAIIPAVDVQNIRINLLSNQMAMFLDTLADSDPRVYNRVGFYSIRFG
jgi:hypothetical protein